MSKSLKEIKARLKEIHDATYGKAEEFNEHTIKRTKNYAQESKELVNKYGDYPNSIEQFDAAIHIYNHHVKNHSHVSDMDNKEAIKAVEYGIQLFFEKA
jgi:hypothetical protein